MLAFVMEHEFEMIRLYKERFPYLRKPKPGEKAADRAGGPGEIGSKAGIEANGANGRRSPHDRDIG